MTEAIKQWIQDQSNEELKTFSNSLGKIVAYKMGLSKGIEIAEGFAEWVCENYSFVGYDKEGVSTWIIPGGPSKTFWKSDLLEKYLEHLSSINKEKL